MHSIRQRLFLIIFGATTFIWLCAAGWIYFSTKNEVERVLDARLMESARMVSSLIGDQNLSPDQAAAHVAQSSAETFTPNTSQYSRQLSCQIWSLEGTLVSRSESAPSASLADHTDGFENTVSDGERWRVYAVVNEKLGVRVLVGDSMKIREALIGDVMKGLALPFLVVLPLLGWLIWICVGRGLEPLTRLAGSLAHRSAIELHPVKMETVPREVLPVVSALNSLFERVTKARDQERSFTAYAAHELKTPLAGLKTQAQIAMRSDDRDIQRQALSHISNSVDRTSRMVRQLIDLARVDSAGEPLRSEPISLAALFGR